MSYILDALRRADAERQRGAVPGLHDQPASAPMADRPSSSRLGAAGLAVTAVLLLVAGGGLAWWLGGQRPVPPAPAPAPAALPLPPVAALPTPPAVVLPVPPAVVVLPPQAGQAPAATAVPALPPAPAPLPSASPPTTATARQATPIDRPAAAAADRPVAPIAARTNPSTLPPTAPPAAAAETPAPARPLRLADLPDALRRDLPTLNLGGSVYADQAAMRMVIINGQVFHEGDRPAADLLVQQIGLKAVVFNFRGQRFELPL